VPVFQSPPVAGTPRFAPVVAKELAQGLSGYWPLDDGPGARLARDHSGADRHCRFHGPRGVKRVWVPGVAGRALALNATTWLDCPQSEVAGEAAVAVTISAWVKRRSPQSPAAVVTRQIGSGYLDHFFLGFKADSVRVLSHAWDGRLIVTVPPSPERWHHLAFTRQREGITRLYLDGVEVAEENTGPQEIGRISTPITIGAGRFSPSPHKVRQHLDGAVDEVLAYGRALSAMEVRALAAGVRPVLPAPTNVAR
jgi:Concanavalin A-like lectin/glucanases superfamily